jgi:cell division protein FtsW
MRSRSAHQDNMVKPPLLYDKWFLVAVISIVSLGLLMMTSASIEVSDKQVHTPFYFLLKQLIFLILGMIAGGFILQIDTRFWERVGGYLLLINLFLLAIVLIPGIGHSVNGSIRWLGYGPFTFQVSELTKLLIVIYMAGYLVRHQSAVHYSVTGSLKPIGLLSVVSILLLREPDFGATVVVTMTVLGMLFLGGMRLRYFAALFGIAFVGLALIAVSAPYRLARLTSFLNPWEHPFDSGYQLTQSLIAFGRGGWLGLGLGQSVQKMFYLPEAHTDFLFAVIAEELGLLGILVVMALFLLFVVRTFVIGRKAQLLNRHFAGFLAYGFGIWIAIQFIVSVGVNSGLLPTKGLTLPLMSYGGSSVLVNSIMIAILLRIDHENRQRALGFQ